MIFPLLVARFVKHSNNRNYKLPEILIEVCRLVVLDYRHLGNKTHTLTLLKLSAYCRRNSRKSLDSYIVTTINSETDTGLKVVEVWCSKVQSCLGDVKGCAKSIQRDMSSQTCSSFRIRVLANEFVHSVSLPFKQDIPTLVTKLSPSAELIGASNTILPIRKAEENQEISDPRGKEHRHRVGPIEILYADNTDWMGICACVSRSISPANSVNPETAGLVIGAGGMAPAAVYCLLYLGVRSICIYNRTPAHAQSLAKHFQKVFTDFVHSKVHNLPRLGEKIQSSGLRIRVLDSVDTPWPEDISRPSIVICAIKAYDRQKSVTPPFRMPQLWMGNPTGGIVVEVRIQLPFCLPCD